MSSLTKAGRFAAQVISAALRKSQSSLAHSVSFELSAYAELSPTNEWVQLPEPLKTYADVYVIGAQGAVNETGVGQLRDALAWDGDVRKIGKEWPSKDATIQISVKEEAYQGKPVFKVSWIYPPDAVAGGIVNAASEGEVDAVHREFGSLFRAALGAQKKPAGAPKPPPTAGAKAAAPIDVDDTPF